MTDKKNDESNEFIDKINTFKEDYYSKNSKNYFFKNAQKNELAQEISNQFELDKLLHSTAFQIANTENVFFDYTVFKLYANDTNYNYIIQHVINLFNHCIIHFGKIVVHVNLDSFSVSAAERYKNIIILFNNACICSEYEYSTKIPQWFIYNTPSVLTMIQKLLKNILDPSIVKKALVYSKQESSQKLRELFA
jgi:hypothetical protein